MAELLSSASAWMTGSLVMKINAPSSSLSMPVHGASAPSLLEVALPSGPSFQRGKGTAPVHFMGGGPRTFPGGVTKWQWKRMQLKKTRQMEKARLMREKNIYEARRRAELIAASPVLEMPWQKLSRVRPPNYVSADEQITKLAARFHKRGAEDLWTVKDGPERFEVMDDDDDGNDLRSSPPFTNTMAHKQDARQFSSQRAGYLDEQWNGAGDAGPRSNIQSMRQMPRIRPGSTPYPEPFPRIRPGSTPYPEPLPEFYRGGSRRPYNQSPS
eukprot:c13546_g1_i1 orf=90-899(-)